METALTDPRKTDINSDFSVSTALFRSRMETRVFSSIDEIPSDLAELITDAVNATKVLDTLYVTPDTAYRYESDDDDEGTPYVQGLGIETYAFTDARLIHDVTVDVIKSFVQTHKRAVTYTPN